MEDHSFRLGDLDRYPTKGKNFDTDFKRYVQRAADACISIIANFPSPPESHGRHNAVTNSAREYSVLSLGSRAHETSLLFEASDAGRLVCDGNYLIDGGITTNHRLWLVYRYDSLTNYHGFNNYTKIDVLITSHTDGRANTLYFGFDFEPKTLRSHLTNDPDELRLTKDVLNPNHWQALHRLQTPTVG